MASLEDRLRALRQAQDPGASSGAATAASATPAARTGSSNSSEDDDIGYLMATTQDEIDVEYDAQYEDADYLGPASESSDSESLDSLDEAAAAGCFDVRAEADALAQEAAMWSASAQQALGELPASVLVPPHQEAGPSQQQSPPIQGQAAQPREVKLERLARPAPVMVRAPSSSALRDEEMSTANEGLADENLADELAAAMVDDGGSLGSSVKDLSSSIHKPGTSSRSAEAAAAPTSDVSDLSQRFAALRSRITAPLAAASTSKVQQPPPQIASSTPQFPSPPSALPDFPALPSAPRDPPPDPTSDDLKARHGIDPDRNLGAFERLVRLDAKRLEEPGAKRAVVQGTTSEESEEEEDGPDSWCCICNADATLLCIGCDADLYCSECWAEGHGRMGREEIREHRTKPFESRRAKKKRGAGSGAGAPPSRRAMAA